MTPGADAARLLWAPAAWIQGRWQADVVLGIDAAGHWGEVRPGEAAPPGAQRLAGPVLPGLVDAHSHAFQRAFAGLAERRAGEADDFWSWRERMYRVARALDPAGLRAVAAQLYVELLAGGYTHVCEFHYLHQVGDGAAGAEPLAFGLALAQAAADAGIGLTWLPALYERAGFAAPALREEQRRFRAGAHEVWERHQAFAQQAAAARRAGGPPLGSGLAIHSLRAADPASITRLRTLADGFEGPLHIHVAEQPAEVRDCLAATGMRPVAWLARHAGLDPRWQLVHATHVVPDEIEAVARAGAGVVLCPTTEANLGDGLPDLPRWLHAGVGLAIGSDSQAGRCWREELRWLEYGQRLRLGRRNVSARPPGEPATAAVLFEQARAQGGRAAGQARWGIEPGARADLLVIDPDDPALAGVPASHRLDALVFSSPARPWRDVLVAGRWTIRDGRHPQAPRLATAFASALASLA